MSERVLLFEPRVSGHRIEYLEHLMRFVNKQNMIDKHFIYLVDKKVLKKSTEIRSILDKSKRQSIIPISSSFKEKYGSCRSSIYRSIVEWRYMRQVAETKNVDVCFVFNLDSALKGLTLYGCGAGSFEVSGILFESTYREDAGSKKLFDKFKRYVKHTCIKVVNILCPIKDIFVMNDSHSANRYNKGIGPSNFQYIPEPIRGIKQNERKVDIREKYNIDKSDTVFLLFGVLRPNKGGVEAVRAFDHEYLENVNDITLLLMGKVREDYKSKLYSAIRNTRKKGKKVIIENRYIEDYEVKSAFEQSDILLCPYRRTSVSSGVIGYAAIFETPVIGPNCGLISDIINKYNLGTSVDVNSTKELSRAIHIGKEDGVSHKKSTMEQYVYERKPTKFARRIVESIV